MSQEKTGWFGSRKKKDPLPENFQATKGIMENLSKLNLEESKVRQKRPIQKKVTDSRKEVISALAEILEQEEPFEVKDWRKVSLAWKPQEEDEGIQ